MLENWQLSIKTLSPSDAIPAAIEAIACSEIPALKNLSGIQFGTALQH